MNKCQCCCNETSPLSNIDDASLLDYLIINLKYKRLKMIVKSNDIHVMFCPWLIVKLCNELVVYDIVLF